MTTVERFAKVFDVGPRQVLAYIEFDNEQDDDLFILHQIFPAPGMMVDVAIRGPEHVMQKLFGMYDQQAAENLMGTEIVKKALAITSEVSP